MKMTQENLRIKMKDLCQGNLRYCDPLDSINIERGNQCGTAGRFTIQSSEEVLDDLISDLTALRTENRIESSFQSANI